MKREAMNRTKRTIETCQDNILINSRLTLKTDSVEDPPDFQMFEDITDCEFHEIVFSNYKELTYNVVKDICVDEGVPLMQEKFLFNETDSIEVISSYFESKSSEDNNKKFEEYVGIQDSQDKLTVKGQEAKDAFEVTPRDVVAISMEEGSPKPPNNNNNINGNEENLVRETKQEKPEETKEDNSSYISFEIGSGQEKKLRKDVVKDSNDHKLCEGESSLAHITYSAPISVSGSFSLISEGSARSFAFPILQSECNSNSSPERMVEADKRQLRKSKGWRHFSLFLCCRF